MTETRSATKPKQASFPAPVRSIYFLASLPRVVTTLAMKKLWAGAVYSRWSPVCYEELPPLELPGPKGIRVRNKVCGIYASDLHFVFVDVDPMIHPAALPGRDRIYLGHEAVGEVIETGPEVETLEVGDRVLMKRGLTGPFCKSLDLPLCRQCEQGHYARCENQSAVEEQMGAGGGWSDEYTCHEAEVWKAPDYLDDDAVALVEAMSCGVRPVLRRRPKPGDKVLVLGCGILGLSTVQALRAIEPEAEVYAAARYPQQQEAARRWGAKVLPKGDQLELTAEHTGGKIYVGDFKKNITMLGGWDVIYDCVGTEQTVNQCLRLTRAGGAVVILGLSLHRFRRLDLSPIWHQEVDLVGSLAHGAEDWEGERLSTLELTARFIRDGQMFTDGLITHRFPLDRWKEAIQTATDKKTGCIKVVFDYGSKG